jgi:Planctomycete cytochrome C
MTIPLGSRSVTLLLTLAGCVNQHGVSYQKDIVPIIESKCIECHSPPTGVGYLKTGLSMTSYESLMKGTIYGPVIIPGDSRHSVLNMVVEGRLNASMRPLNPPTEEEIAILRLWVDQGAKNN